jgi:hypothetical protein
MSLISAGSISLDSTFKYTPYLFYKKHFKSEMSSFCIRALYPVYTVWTLILMRTKDTVNTRENAGVP